MHNNPTISFPEDEHEDNKEQELRLAFTFDIEVNLPDGSTGKVSGITAGDSYEGPSKDATVEDLMQNGIPLEIIKNEAGEQALSNKDISDIYKENMPALIFTNYFTPENISPTFKVLIEGSIGDMAQDSNSGRTIPLSPVPIKRIFPAVPKTELPARGIVPPENRQENPYIIRNIDDDISLIIESVARRVPVSHKIRHFDKKYYYYDSTLRHYIVLLKQDLRYFIDSEPEIQQIKFKHPGIHDRIVNLILNDSSLHLDNSQVIDLIPDVWIFKNFIVDITTEEVWRNDGTFFCRHALSANYDRSADCPNFKAFIKSAANNSVEVEILLWQIIGYLLSTDTKAKKFFLFFGERDCGKSLLGDVIADLIGRDNVSNLSPHSFADRFASSETVDKLLLTCMDMPDAEISNKSIGLLKQITGRDSIYSEKKNKDAVSKPPISKILLGSNFPLKLSASDEALKSRLITVPFTHRIRPEEQDHQLKNTLLQEASGICNTAMGYYRNLMKNNYAFQSLYVDMPVSVIDSSALLKDFTEQHIVFTGNYNDSIKVEELFTLFKLFCNRKGVYNPLSKDAFSKNFRMLHYYDTSQYPDKTIPTGCVWKGKIKINGSSVQGFRGIRISTSMITS